ncbi:MAG: hypothetical protein ACE5DX_03725 [Candidatus Dojkabacteria bacterium]
MSVDPNNPVSNSDGDQKKNDFVEPDEQTVERIANLGIVGEALNEQYSEENIDLGTDFFLAKEGLNKFKAGILRLNLAPRSRKGMLDLINFLQKEIDRRMNTKESSPNF